MSTDEAQAMIVSVSSRTAPWPTAAKAAVHIERFGAALSRSPDLRRALLEIAAAFAALPPSAATMERWAASRRGCCRSQARRRSPRRADRTPHLHHHHPRLTARFPRAQARTLDQRKLAPAGQAAGAAPLAQLIRQLISRRIVIQHQRTRVAVTHHPRQLQHIQPLGQSEDRLSPAVVEVQLRQLPR